jgi:SRSO17 transposase
MAARGGAKKQAEGVSERKEEDARDEADEALVAPLRQAAGEVPMVATRIGRRFARAEARRRAQAYLSGLLSPLERKNGWQLAEAVGDTTPYALQHLLDRADWDADAVRDDLRAYVIAQLGDPAAVLVVDETGFVKKGTKSAGVAKQYTGTLGKIENCQVGVFLASASPRGVAFLDRALYLPQEWTDDAARCQAAHIPDAVGFATKPELARALLERARGAGVPAAWVTADSIYGDDRRLRMGLEAQEQAYVLAVSGKEYVNVAATWTQRRVSTLLSEVAQQPAAAWQRLSAGAGTKGPRHDDWFRLPLVPPLQEGYERWFLVRRSHSDPQELQGYVTFAPAGTTLEHLVRVAGSRWTIEVAFEAAKGEVGLDQYEVRSYHGWYRHITLALFAQALLTVIRHRLSVAPAPRGSRQASHPTPRQKGLPQQAGWPSRTTRPTRRGGGRASMAACRRQRQAQQGRWQRRSVGPTASLPSPSSS